MGKAEGTGNGQGEAQGQGRGTDDTSVAVGAGLAVGCTVLFCVFGIPMLIAGAVFVTYFTFGTLYNAGIALISVSSILTVVGLILVILLCAGVIGKKTRVSPETTVMTVHTQGQYPGPQGHVPPGGYSQSQGQPSGYMIQQVPPGGYSQGQGQPSGYIMQQVPPGVYCQGQGQPSGYNMQGQVPPDGYNQQYPPPPEALMYRNQPKVSIIQ